MEIIFEILFEFVFAFIWEVIVAAWEHYFGRKKLRKAVQTSSDINLNPPSGYVISLLYLIGGSMIGALSVSIFPETYITNENGRILSLIITPLLAGLVMFLIGKRRAHYGKQVVSMEKFWHGYMFAFGISLLRFILTA